jgi:hypothetical protein
MDPPELTEGTPVEGDTPPVDVDGVAVRVAELVLSGPPPQPARKTPSAVVNAIGFKILLAFTWIPPSRNHSLDLCHLGFGFSIVIRLLGLCVFLEQRACQPHPP